MALPHLTNNRCERVSGPTDDLPDDDDDDDDAIVVRHCQDLAL